MNDVVVQAEARRKAARSVSRATGKPVGRSGQTLQVNLPHTFAGISMNASFRAPAQIDDDRAMTLARMQMVGFFHFLTYDTAANRGYWWRGSFYRLHGTIKSDWGNPVHRSFMKEVATWDHRLILTTAGGYFRALIRRHPNAECWAWALEWNDSYRLVGFFGDERAVKDVGGRMSVLSGHSLVEEQNRWVRFRVEEALDENEDTLFELPTET